MSDAPTDTAAREINRLHEEVVRQADDSRKRLDAALTAAWHAGQLLLAEQKRVHRTMGGAWGLWLQQKFSGSPRTAQNYMRLAESTPDVSDFQGLSLRQVYLRLGIATESKHRANSVRVGPLPAHIRLASKLLVALKTRSKSSPETPEQWLALRQDLRALYDQLRGIFEKEPAQNARPNLSHPVFADKNAP
jgi:hypothetical protein